MVGFVLPRADLHLLLRLAGSAPCQNKHVLGENIYLPGANYIFVLYFIK